MNFDAAFHKLLGHEGGYSDHPSDPGGETMWGVTARVARANGYQGAMRDLPLDLAKAIYRKDYWMPCRCEELPEALKYPVFDAGVDGAAAMMFWMLWPLLWWRLLW